jgi:hypothetical protein
MTIAASLRRDFYRAVAVACSPFTHFCSRFSRRRATIARLSERMQFESFEPRLQVDNPISPGLQISLFGCV